LAAFAPATLAVLDARKDEFRRRRNYLVDALGGLGLGIAVRPGGAFYAFADSAAVSQDSEILARDLLEYGGVAATPGKDFGVTVVRRYVRFSYTTNMARLRDGVGRIGRALQRQPQ
jgi:aspartate/methionine/tyrosine aminotransferase